MCTSRVMAATNYRSLPRAGAPVGGNGARTKPIAKPVRTLQDKQSAMIYSRKDREDRLSIEAPKHLVRSRRKTERIFDEYKAQESRRNEEARNEGKSTVWGCRKRIDTKGNGGDARNE